MVQVPADLNITENRLVWLHTIPQVLVEHSNSFHYGKNYLR